MVVEHQSRIGTKAMARGCTAVQWKWGGFLGNTSVVALMLSGLNWWTGIIPSFCRLYIGRNETISSNRVNKIDREE